MKQAKTIRIFSLLLALVIALVSTIMILGIQINFNQSNKAAKITAPMIIGVCIAVLFIFKFAKKRKHTSIAIAIAEKKGNKLGPYATIFFTYFDYMIWCIICSVSCAALSGVFTGLHEKLVFDWLISWSYTLEILALVFIIYLISLFIYTFGLMLAYDIETRSKNEN